MGIGEGESAVMEQEWAAQRSLTLSPGNSKSVRLRRHRWLVQEQVSHGGWKGLQEAADVLGEHPPLPSLEGPYSPRGIRAEGKNKTAVQLSSMSLIRNLQF